MIECDNISLSFGKKNIFKDVSFIVEEGEFITIKGESGTGKSSLLKMLQGYIPYSKGNIKIKGELLNVDSISYIRNNIIWIPQNVNLPVKNGVELMQLMALDNHISQVELLLGQLGLNPVCFIKLSKGKWRAKQRIIIAICLSINKPIVLMDEPTSSLDEASIKLLLTTVKDLKNKTVLSTSHNATWIENSNRVVELK